MHSSLLKGTQNTWEHEELNASLIHKASSGRDFRTESWSEQEMGVSNPALWKELLVIQSLHCNTKNSLEKSLLVVLVLFSKPGLQVDSVWNFFQVFL